MPTHVIRVNEFISLRLAEPQGFRDARGRFASAQGAAYIRNRAAAERLQEMVVDNIESRITREEASTGRLARVTASPENATYDAFRIGVGVPAFLNNSVAKYWRTFEQGSEAVWTHPFVGTQLMPKGSGRPPYPVAHGATPGIRTTSASLPWMDGKRWVVKHEIAPRYAYRDAAERFNLLAFERNNLRRLVEDTLGRGPR